MTRILYLITSTSIGGTERVLAEICRRLDRRRYLPTVVSLKSEGPVAAEMRNAGTEVLSLGMREPSDWLSVVEFAVGLWRIPRLLQGRSFDILHSFLYRANIFGRLAAGRCGITRIVNSVRADPDEESRLMRRVDLFTLPRVHVVCALSEALGTELREKLSLPPEKISVIPNGIDTSLADRAVTGARSAARRRFGLADADMVVAAIGRLHRQKGFAHLLAAFRPFALEHPRGMLLLAGEGAERENLLAQAEELRIADRVILPGAVTTPWEVLAAADLFVLPSLTEGMPNVLLEAMAASLPVVATGVGAVSDMIENGREGFLVPHGDSAAMAEAMDRLAWSADLRRKMGGHGRRLVEQSFSPEAMMESLCGLYRDLLGGDPEGPAAAGAPLV